MRKIGKIGVLLVTSMLHAYEKAEESSGFGSIFWEIADIKINDELRWTFIVPIL